MAKKEVKKKFSFSYDKLVEICRGIAMFIFRDMVKFTLHGMTAPILAAYNTQIRESQFGFQPMKPNTMTT